MKPLTKAAIRALEIRQSARLDAAAVFGFALLLSLLLLSLLLLSLILLISP